MLVYSSSGSFAQQKRGDPGFLSQTCRVSVLWRHRFTADCSLKSLEVCVQEAEDRADQAQEETRVLGGSVRL